MHCLMGIDLGTSSVKIVIMTTDGVVISIGQKQYTFDVPIEGWAEQHPEVWWNATIDAMEAALSSTTIQPKEIIAVGFSGQMHGLVALDIHHKPVRKAIIWCDQRSIKQVKAIEELVGLENLGRIAHSPIATGFQTASLLWMKENEPDLFSKTHIIFHLFLLKIVRNLLYL